MIIDRSTKLLLTAIAIALWMIALNPWLKPVPVAAQGESAYWLEHISAATGTIAMGTCRNAKICGQVAP